MRVLPEITVRHGDLGDLHELMDVADSFFQYGGTDSEHYDRDTFMKSAIQYLSGVEGTGIMVALHEDVVVGYYALAFNKVYSLRPIMYEAHFAVHPDFVVSHAGRKLTAAAVEFGKSVGALCFYAGATSGIKRFDKSILNLYAKHGFVNSGAMMRYDYG